MTNTIIFVLLSVLLFAAVIYLLILLIRSLRKYIGSKEVRQEKSEIKKNLGEVLKEHRVACKMTQEFVAERIGVSRQAVSKWESGISDPSTSNLIALAKLFGTSVEALLAEVNNQKKTN